MIPCRRSRAFVWPSTPGGTPAFRRSRANGDGTVCQRKDERWEAAGYVLAVGDARKRVRVYRNTRGEALAKLTERIAFSNRGVPAPSTQGSVAVFLTYWLETVSVHQLRENTHTRYAACTGLYTYRRRGPPTPGSPKSAWPAK